MYRFLDRLNRDDVEAICAMAYVEMLETGYTRVGEFHYLHKDTTGARYSDPAEMAGCVVAAAQATGIGLTLLPVFYAHSDFGGVSPNHGQRRFINDLDSFATLLDACRCLIPAEATLGIAPHSLREDLGALIKIHKDGPIHIHAAVLDIPDIGAAIAERTSSCRFALLSSALKTCEIKGGDFDLGTKLRSISGIHHGSGGPFAHEARSVPARMFHTIWKSLAAHPA